MGRGISDKFARGGNDIVTVDGHSGLAAKIRQALLTRRGEVPWDPDLGSDLHRIRHRGISASNLAASKALAIRALVGLSDVADIAVEAFADDNAIKVQVRYRYRPDGRTGVVETTV